MKTKLSIALCAIAIGGCASTTESNIEKAYKVCLQKAEMIKNEMPPEDLGNGYTIHGEMRCDLESMDLVITGPKDNSKEFKDMLKKTANDLCKDANEIKSWEMGIKKISAVHRDESGKILVRRVSTIGTCKYEN